MCVSVLAGVRSMHDWIDARGWVSHEVEQKRKREEKRFVYAGVLLCDFYKEVIVLLFTHY